MTPIDLIKEHKALYSPSAKEPGIVEVPERTFLMVEGRGDPESSQEFQEAMGALYSAAYTMKFTFKKSDPEREFKVAPLEGLWWADVEKPSMGDLQADRAGWNWTVMIPVPDVVTTADVAAALEAAAERRPVPAAGRLRLERFEEGLAAQIMHVGPYSEEEPTIARLHAFVEEQGYELRGRHHEIYMGDPRRAAPERLKTIIRHPVEPA